MENARICFSFPKYVFFIRKNLSLSLKTNEQANMQMSEKEV